MRLFLIAMVLSVTFPIPLSAQSNSCDRLIKPSSSVHSTARHEIDSRPSDVENYTRRMRNYLQCLEDQAEAASTNRRNVRKKDDGVDRFNNR